jgi:hypothetical protein
VSTIKGRTQFGVIREAGILPDIIVLGYRIAKRWRIGGHHFIRQLSFSPGLRRKLVRTVGQRILFLTRDAIGFRHLLCGIAHA